MDHINDVEARTFEDVSVWSYVASTFPASFCAILFVPGEILASVARSSTTGIKFVFTVA